MVLKKLEKRPICLQITKLKNVRITTRKVCAHMVSDANFCIYLLKSKNKYNIVL